MFELNNVLSYGKSVKVSAGTAVFSEGAAPKNTMYVVFAGRVGLFSQTIAPPQNTQFMELFPGGIFGEDTLFASNPYNYGAVATESSLLIAISSADFERACTEVPSFASNVVKALTQKLNCLLYGEILPITPSKPAPAPKAATPAPAAMPAAPKAPAPAPAAPSGASSNNSVTLLKADPDIFPFGYTLMHIKEPETYPEYVYEDDVVCPVCKKPFTAKRQMISRLSLLETTYDLHKRYKNFESTWYNVWTCPHCYYSNLNYDFEEVSDTFNPANLLNYTQKILDCVRFSFTTPKTIDEPIIGYYIALFCASIYQAPFLKIAKLWLQLSWLYKEAGNDDMFMKASGKAKEYYDKMYYNSHETLDPVNEQACLIVMAELNILFKDYDASLTLLSNAKRLEGGNRYYSMRADRRYADVREMATAQRKAAQAGEK